MDYPFTNWTDYYSALTESLNTEFFGKTYPEYEKVQQEDVDIVIIRELLNKCDPQMGFDGFLTAMIRGHRYAMEMKESISQIIDLFMEKHVIINLDLVFPTCQIEDWNNFEDEVASYEIRGFLIDLLSKYPIDVSSYGDWKMIQPLDFEDIPTDGSFDYRIACLMVLKYHSKYLQSL